MQPNPAPRRRGNESTHRFCDCNCDCDNHIRNLDAQGKEKMNPSADAEAVLDSANIDGLSAHHRAIAQAEIDALERQVAGLKQAIALLRAFRDRPLAAPPDPADTR